MSKARLVITAVIVEKRPVSEVARAYGVARSWVCTLLARYRAEGEGAFEPRSRRPKTSPSAIGDATVALIIELRKDLSGQGLDAGPDTIAWHLAHHYQVRVSAATVARYLARHGLVVPEPSKRPKSSYIRFAAEQPNECWQSDFTQLLALPADPARLKELLLTGSSHYPQVSQSAYLLQAVPPVLQMPVTPAVRSALYRMLAAMPGIQSLGTVKDVAGKHGAAVAYTGRYANCGNGIPLNDAVSLYRVLFTSCTVQQVLVIDPATGLPQAEELRYMQLPPGQKWSAPTGLFSYEIFGRSHWTNHNRPKVK
jgi:transposase